MARQPTDQGTEWAIRELFNLPNDGDLFERMADWEESRVVGEVRLQNAVHNMLSEPLYEDGKKENGVSVAFLMRLTMLANEAGLKGYSKTNKCVREAIAALGDPGQPNIAEHVGSAKYAAQCQAWVRA